MTERANVDEAWPPEGDPARHVSLERLQAALTGLAPGPTTGGRLDFLVRRTDDGERREALETVRLDPEAGLPGDRWSRRLPLKPEAQLAVMQTPVARLIANGQPLTLFGDNLFLDLDLSEANLPIGSRVRIGEALLEVTPKAHNGCKKFRARFGDGALRFVAAKETRHRNLRGIYLRVVEAGDVHLGSTVEVVLRHGST